MATKNQPRQYPAVETLFEFHESTGNPATFVIEPAPGFSDQDVAPVINMIAILSGTPAQIAFIQSVIAGAIL